MSASQSDLFSISDGNNKKSKDNSKDKDQIEVNNTTEDKVQDSNVNKNSSNKLEDKESIESISQRLTTQNSEKIKNLIAKGDKKTLKKDFDLDDVDIKLLQDAHKDVRNQRVQKFILLGVVLFISLFTFGYVIFQNRQVLMLSFRGELKDALVVGQTYNTEQKNNKTDSIIKTVNALHNLDKQLENMISKNNLKQIESTSISGQSKELTQNETQTLNSNEPDDDKTQNNKKESNLQNQDSNAKSNQIEYKQNSKTNFHLQLGAYSSFDNANKLVDALSQYNLKVQQTDKYFKVITNSYQNKQQLQNIQKELNDVHQIQSMLIQD